MLIDNLIFKIFFYGEIGFYLIKNLLAPLVIAYISFSYFRPTISSSNLFQNPYGPPFYPRQRPLIEGNSAAPKKKARRMQKMIKLTIPTMENGSKSTSSTITKRSKSLPRPEQIFDQARLDLNT